LIKLTISAALLAPFLIIGASSVALAQEVPNPAEQDLAIDAMMDLDIAADQADNGSVIEADLPPNVHEVRDVSGELIEPFVEAQRCANNGCGLVIINIDTGELAYSMDVWQAGFMPTRNGEQVVQVLNLNSSDEPAQ
jgi:hypothetical protein